MASVVVAWEFKIYAWFFTETACILCVVLCRTIYRWLIQLQYTVNKVPSSVNTILSCLSFVCHLLLLQPFPVSVACSNEPSDSINLSKNLQRNDTLVSSNYLDTPYGINDSQIKCGLSNFCIIITHRLVFKMCVRFSADSKIKKALQPRANTIAIQNTWVFCSTHELLTDNIVGSGRYYIVALRCIWSNPLRNFPAVVAVGMRQTDANNQDKVSCLVFCSCRRQHRSRLPTPE